MKVGLKKETLLKILRDNKETHVKDYEEAREAYKAKLVETLEFMLVEAKEHGRLRHPDGSRTHVSIGLVNPVTKERDYDRAIKMVEMTNAEEVDLSQREFAEFVMDDWEWADSVRFSNSAYK